MIAQVIRQNQGYYSQTEAAQLLGIERWQLQWLIDSGRVTKPSKRSGRGSRKYYETADIERMRELMK